MGLTAGAKLGPYEILSPLGAGGMGEVYRARDPRLGREVALKVLPAGVADDRSRRARFEQEARSASALNHPNIITVYDLGASEGVAYIVTELVEGESLRDVINRGPLAPRKLLDVAVQLADGLAAAHAAGIVHRDLKPENIMLTREGRVKILDFGLAKQAGPATPPDGRTVSMEQTQPGTVLGTVNYMSPEQARGAAVDFHSDQFSFGLILYEAACGKKAFQKAESVQTLAAIITEDYPPLDAKVPGPLRWAIDRCLAKEPRERYDSTRDLYYELRNLRDHLSESFTTAAGITHPAPRRKRRWLLAGGLVAALLAGFLLAQLVPRQQDTDFTQERFTPIGADTEVSRHAAWSPDGKSFAYTGVVDGQDEIFIRSLGSSMSTQVTRAPAGELAFWSPDSSRVFYYKAEGQYSDSLWSVAVAGGEPELVMKDLVTATISPDGKALALLRTEAGVTSVWVSSPVGAPPRTYSPSRVEKTNIFNRPQLVFSPDGSKILVSIAGTTPGAKTSEQEWWLIPYPGNSGHPPRRILQPLLHNATTTTFSWMPDSRHLVMALRRGAQSESHLRMVDTQSDAVRLLTAGLDSEQWPAASPDGQKIIFEELHFDYDLAEVPLTGGPSQVLLATDREEFNPAWSPVANQFAYVTDRNGPQEIWLKSVQDGWSRPLVTPEQFSDPTVYLWGPAFSPDGSRIAYLRVGGDNTAWIWISSTGGGAPVRLTHEAATVSESPPAWSPDGNWLAYTRYAAGSIELVKFRLGSSEPPVVLKKGIAGPVPAWSPAGDWIAFFASNGDAMLISPDGKSERNLGQLKTDYLLWSRDGKTLYGIHPDENRHQILFSLEVASGRQKDVADLGTEFQPAAPLSPGNRYSLAPDGKSFALSIRKYRSDLWMLENFNPHRGWLGR